MDNINNITIKYDVIFSSSKGPNCITINQDSYNIVRN